MNKKYKFILMLLIVILTVSSYFFIKEIAENRKENDIYDDLQEIVQSQETEDKANESSMKEQTNENNYNLENIAKINSDVIGWIKVDGTNIDYPVMQNKNFYLHKNIYKNYSSHGTPYLAEYCDLKTSDNLIIYGHHMNDNSMFSGLVNYKNYQFYKNHKYIKFYTLIDGQTVGNIYEIIVTFKTIAYSDNGFKYYNYINFYNDEDFKSYISNCQKLEFYNTEISANYGDKLITLSTCEYSQKNGRMVVVAKKI